MKDTFLLQSGQTFVFIGDSITADAQGYTMLVPEMVKLRYPERNIKFINAGAGGNRCVDMLDRFDSDVLQYKPNWVSVTSGANDAGRFITNPSEGIDIEVYSDAIRQMVEKTIKVHAFPILISPPLFEPNWAPGGVEKANKILDKYTTWMRKYAQENQLLYVPMQEIFLQVSKKARRKNPGFRLAEDGVHMNFQGRLLMTITLLRYLGFDWKVG